MFVHSVKKIFIFWVTASWSLGHMKPRVYDLKSKLFRQSNFETSQLKMNVFVYIRQFAKAGINKNIFLDYTMFS